MIMLVTEEKWDARFCKEMYAEEDFKISWCVFIREGAEMHIAGRSQSDSLRRMLDTSDTESCHWKSELTEDLDNQCRAAMAKLY